MVIQSPVFPDQRGFLYERYNQELTESLAVQFCQQNVSSSKLGVIRGMHWQFQPHAQGKLVTCLSGKIFDVAVDIRMTSPTFGNFVTYTLTGNSATSIWIPPGFAHGFQSLEEESVVTYSVTSPFAPEHAAEFNPLDEQVGIRWPISDYQISTKDRSAPRLSDLTNSSLFE